MKKLIALFLAAALTLFGCAADPAETTEPTTEPVIPDGLVSLEQYLYNSDISMLLSGNDIFLKEDDMTVEFNQDSVLVRREGYIVAVMDQKPCVIDGALYVDEDFFSSFLYREGEDGISLFNGMLFLADEILEALDQPEASAFNQKLLDEVLLPQSMGIETPHVNIDRVFQDSPLSEYPETLTQELTDLGYGNAGEFVYGEYVILTGAQTLTEAGMEFVLDNYEGLSNADPGEMTVAEYTEWERRYSRQTYADGLGEEEKAFALEMGIELTDLTQLEKVFFGEYMERPEEEIKAVLEQHYETAIAYLQGMASD